MYIYTYASLDGESESLWVYNALLPIPFLSTLNLVWIQSW